jgi:hypothetical protein
MGIYVGVEYMQTIHYYYFCMGIFSFTAAFIFGFPYSVFFIVFCILHSVISWYIAWFMQKRMKKFVIMESAGYMLSHVLLTVFTAGLTLVLWYYQIFMERFLIDSIIQINYFVFFLGMLWYVMTRFSLVISLFEYFDSLTLRRAKGLIIRKREELGLKKLMTDMAIKSYETGSDREMDSMLISLWRERDTNLLENVYEFENALCERTIEKFRKRVEKLKSRPVQTAIEQKMIRSYERFIKDYQEDALEYEKFFRKKHRL